MKALLECEGSFPHTFLHSRASSWPVTLQALALVVSPKLGLQQWLIMGYISSINKLPLHPFTMFFIVWPWIQIPSLNLTRCDGYHQIG